MFQISGIIVDKSGRDYSGNMENARDLKTERKKLSGISIRVQPQKKHVESKFAKKGNWIVTVDHYDLPRFTVKYDT